MASSAVNQSLAAVSKDMFRNGEFADMTISCKGRTWKGHRNVLCARCPFFKAACTSGFKESQTLVIRLDDDDQDAVDMMLEHLYTLEKPTLLTAKAKHPNIAEKAYIIGDKYDLPSLRSVGKSSLEAMTRVQFQSWDAKNEASKRKNDRLDTKNMVVEAGWIEVYERALCGPTSWHVRVNSGLRAFSETDVGEQGVWHAIHRGNEEAGL